MYSMLVVFDNKLTGFSVFIFLYVILELTFLENCHAIFEKKYFKFEQNRFVQQKGSCQECGCIGITQSESGEFTITEALPLTRGPSMAERYVRYYTDTDVYSIAGPVMDKQQWYGIVLSAIFKKTIGCVLWDFPNELSSIRANYPDVNLGATRQKSHYKKFKKESNENMLFTEGNAVSIARKEDFSVCNLPIGMSKPPKLADDLSGLIPFKPVCDDVDEVMDASRAQMTFKANESAENNGKQRLVYKAVHNREGDGGLRSTTVDEYYYTNPEGVIELFTASMNYNGSLKRQRYVLIEKGLHLSAEPGTERFLSNVARSISPEGDANELSRIFNDRLQGECYLANISIMQDL